MMPGRAIAEVPLELRVAIEDLVAEFAYRVDFERGLTVPELFCPDGYYESDGRRSTGRDAIRAAYERRAAFGPRTARHLFTNLRVRRGYDGDLRATSLMLLFAENGKPPLPAVPLLVADVADRYQIVDGRPLISSRTLTSIFVREGAAPVLPLGEDATRGR
jgi:hypothetical protein